MSHDCSFNCLFFFYITVIVVGFYYRCLTNIGLTKYIYIYKIIIIKMCPYYYFFCVYICVQSLSLIS